MLPQHGRGKHRCGEHQGDRSVRTAILLLAVLIFYFFFLFEEDPLTFLVLLVW